MGGVSQQSDTWINPDKKKIVTRRCALRLSRALNTIYVPTVNIPVINSELNGESIFVYPLIITFLMAQRLDE